MNVISLGAGVQSTTMALLAAHGELTPMPDCAIFADTGWEPRAVYDHLRWLMSPNVLPFPVHVVSAGNIRDDLLARSSARNGRFVNVPAHLVRTNNRLGIGRRQCTTHYKVEPLAKKMRELLGVGSRGYLAPGAVTTWVGISLDEIYRATPSRVQYQIKRFPLLELKITRRDCLTWLEARDYPIPAKSACIGCPYHGDAEWRAIKARPDEWAQAVEVDHAIREEIDRPGVRARRVKQYLHPQRVPLDKVDLSTHEERGQLNLFNEECEGLCGV